ncbi:unnamed protein product, partial [Iphiclides podalirius]
MVASAALPSDDLRPARVSERASSGERGARVGGERTHLDKCTIWHCSRENRRPCAPPTAAPPSRRLAAPANHAPSRHSLRPFWREPLGRMLTAWRAARRHIASFSALPFKATSTHAG